MNGKLSGTIAITLEENTTPTAPPIDAPIANDHSLKRKVGTPISSAASSSSRMATHACPTRLFSNRLTTTITRTASRMTR